MERLTKKHWQNLDPWECCGQDYYCKRSSHEPGGCTKGCIVPKLYDRLAAYEDTGLEPEEVKDTAENAETRLLTWFESQYGYSVGALMDLLDAKKAGRLLVLDEETSLAIAACAHGCNTNKRLFGASYMRHIRSDNPQSISYYRAIEILNEIAEKALEGETHNGTEE